MPNCKSEPTIAALLLDPERRERDELAYALRSHGLEVTATDRPEEAILLALELRPALVVLELRLLEGSGLEVLSRLRPELPSSKFVMLTRYGSVASAVRAMRLGATDYVCKPANVADLLRDVGAGHGHEGHALTWPENDGGLTLDEAIWEYVHRTLETSGSLSEAARRLGLWRQSLKRMISKERPSRARPAFNPQGART